MVGPGATPKRWSSIAPLPVRPEDAAYLPFRLNGTGATGMNVDGSGTAQSFRVVAPARKLAVHRVIFHMRDVDIEYQNFAGLGAVLTNGVGVNWRDAADTILLDFMGGVALDTTIEFAHLAGSDIAKVQSGVGQDPDVVVVRWSLFKAGIVPILDPGEYIEILVRDNLTGLDEFEGVVQGWYP